jgi:hypothetical protein
LRDIAGKKLLKRPSKNSNVVSAADLKKPKK